MDEQDFVNEAPKRGDTYIEPMLIWFFSSKEIYSLISMETAISLMEKAFISLSAEKSEVPQRYVTEFKERDLKLLLKPSFSEDIDCCGVKILTQKEKAPSLNLPTIMGVMHLIDAQTGEFLAIMDGTSITALRTGAASGIATKYLSREDSQVLAIFGCGAQGRTQLEAVCAVRDIQKAYVYDIRPKTAENFIKDMQSKVEADIQFTDDLTFLSKADIICTATGAESPLFQLDQIKEGVHINAIGSFQPHMQEIDPQIIKASRLFVEQKSASMVESGDLIIPVNNKIITEDHLIGEIGEVFIGNKVGRDSEEDITLFKSVGIAVQDLMVAEAVYHKGDKKSMGTKIEL
ncbi:MAG: hypothetical protein V5A59_08075 [Bacteroidales bacterium]|nr:hypothetical protein [Bacteroidales bacterium]